MRINHSKPASQRPLRAIETSYGCLSRVTCSPIHTLTLTCKGLNPNLKVTRFTSNDSLFFCSFSFFVIGTCEIQLKEPFVSSVIERENMHK